MSWRDLVCLIIVIAGIISFLYGANYYNATVGWTGIGLFAAGILGYTVLKIYETERDKKKQPKTAELRVSDSGSSSAA